MPEVNARLVFKDREVPLSQEVTVIGRSQGNDVVVSEAYVSSTHAEIELTEEGYILRDLNSTNGTYVNGREIHGAYPLRNGDEVNLAKVCRFAFHSDHTTALLPEKCGIHIEKELRQATVDGHKLDLSPHQYRLLRYLYDKAPEPCSRDELIKYVWGGTGIGISDATVDSLVHRVRKSIADVDPDHDYLVTLRGYGFRLRNKR